MKKYGTSYYYATLFFPRRIKDDVMTLYKFVRIPDLVVDDGTISLGEARTALDQLWNEWEEAYSAWDISHPVRWDSVEIFLRCHIPFSLSKDFRDAMIMDTEKQRYDTYEELQQYMYGSAMVVWEMMCYVVDNQEQQALPYARALGEAMQYTNFLRDVKEDIVELGRIYMPLKELQKYDISYDDIERYASTWIIDQKRENYMKAQIARADSLYNEAIEGVHYLPRDARKAIYLSAKLYQEILRKIERRWYNVFAYSAKTAKRDKLRILLTHIR